MAFIIYKEKNIYTMYMNNSERIYNIEETVSYLASKIEKDNRIILNLLKKLIDKVDNIEKKQNNSINDLSSSIQI
tara:strand:+ start:254 stop:478 length:225 start_codon:yes stop_codon:yes gene_type:complete